MGDSTGPRSQEGVWHHEYGNGYIRRVDYREDDVYVFFWRRELTTIGPHEEVFSLDIFDYFNDTFNQWWII